jgi:hypothetical protein
MCKYSSTNIYEIQILFAGYHKPAKTGKTLIRPLKKRMPHQESENQAKVSCPKKDQYPALCEYQLTVAERDIMVVLYTV